MFFALEPIVRKCYYEDSFSYLAAMPENLIPARQRMKYLTSFFNLHHNYDLGAILVPDECFPERCTHPSYHMMNNKGTYYKLVRIPNMMEYWLKIGGVSSMNAKYVAIGISRKVFKAGQPGILMALFSKMDSFQPAFSLGFL